eukprot:1756529-Prymnesium_polylepis.1
MHAPGKYPRNVPISITPQTNVKVHISRPKKSEITPDRIAPPGDPRSTAVSTDTSCARATFDTLNYTPDHVRTRLHTCAHRLRCAHRTARHRVAPVWR